jgi:hypothetical protein
MKGLRICKISKLAYYDLFPHGKGKSECCTVLFLGLPILGTFYEQVSRLAINRLAKVFLKMNGLAIREITK